MKKVFAVLAISTLVAFTSCKKADDAATTATDSVKTEAPAVTEAPAPDTTKAEAPAADTAKKVEEVKH